MNSKVKHAILVVIFTIHFLVSQMLAGGIRVFPPPGAGIDPVAKYGYTMTVILYTIRILVLGTVPLSICNFLGLLFWNAFPDKPTLKSSPMLAPFVCFRVVTRGLFPDLVKKNVERNHKICSEVGLENYIFEVVTDRQIDIPKQNHVREILVPMTYKTKKGSMYKARALQYCLEDGVNYISDEDWIVHLDEETLLTRDSVIGILNFVNEGTHQFGQGVITYANEDIVAWIPTLGDLVRVGIDYGQNRFMFNYFHRPYVGLKGSYVVVNAGVERKITFDFGPEGSIAEDCFFAMKGIEDGYSFGWIDGDMWEKSPFSFYDWLKQRSRWVQGIVRVFVSGQIPRRQKWGLLFIIVGWALFPLSTVNGIFTALTPIPTPQWLDFLLGLNSVYIFLYIFGSLKSFSYARLGYFRYICLLLSPLLLIPFFVIIENIAVIMAAVTNQGSFHIVEKDVSKSMKKPENVKISNNVNVV
ncbi:beta-1,4-mannosyltransferase egh [Lingula anatina]|uniref:Beta-1,4-mannosyltransferase egh n=1 Tax=Lingula anatina TaxID=7574 RepID=A0A1S3IZD9_LINAN|nr:beta-1,4-mannosyltransferase egh [Lingula anatina]|eukprot:XP_013402914.1 beta-1,4-mannosyltransferase egh [Lingula anatina]